MRYIAGRWLKIGCVVPDVVLALQNLSRDEEAAVEGALDIIVEMLAITPSQRPDALSVLGYAFFSDTPAPTTPDVLHSLQTRECQPQPETSCSACFLSLIHLYRCACLAIP
jgi:hypothetical protein